MDKDAFITKWGMKGWKLVIEQVIRDARIRSASDEQLMAVFTEVVEDWERVLLNK